jgi:hypothetical protein
MKNLFKKITLLLALVASSINTTTQNGNGNSTPSDAYRDIRYSEAFDQAAIYQKHKKLLIKLGCAHNVFSADDLAQTAQEMDNAEYQAELKKFEKECFSALSNARFIALSQPGIKTLSYIALVTAAVALTMKYTDKESAGNSIAFLNLAFNAAFVVPELIGTGYNLLYTPDNALKELENHFAKNMCYIPNVLWPKIINAFTSARQSEFGREAHTNFLNFTLNLTTYKPKNSLVFKDDMSADEIKNELAARIDSFFSNYKQSQDSDSLNHIQINVAKFIDELIDPTSKTKQGPRYIYLHGVGGIGKTHFVQTLSDWLEELIPGSVRFEEIVINSSVELEGSEQLPGALLKALRNQLMQNKRGSIVMFDEATWLNDPSMISSAKRIFNGDRSKLSASYFGSNIDGTAVSLDMPPMLIFVASNNNINDDALASRFDLVHYPIPTKQALFEHALKIAACSKILKNKQISIDKKAVLNWIENLSEKNYNFRYITGNIENFLLTKKDTL